MNVEVVHSPQVQVQAGTLRGTLQQAVVWYRLGKYDECKSACLELLERQPQNADALHLLGVSEIQQGNHETALGHLEQALAVQTDNAEFHANYGTLLSQCNRVGEALHHLRRALALKPDYAQAHVNLASVLTEQRSFHEAVHEYQLALALDPGLPGAYSGLGCAYKQLLQFPEAIAAFRKAITLRENNPEAHCNLALVLLQVGAFQEGWREYEWRFQSKNWGPRTFRQQRWNGESLLNRKILIPSEQGLGDTIQFIRYLPELTKRGARVVFESPPALKRLLTGFPGIDLLIDWPRSTDVESGVDCYVPLMSLPLHFETTLQHLPARIPYLAAPPEVQRDWNQRLPESGVKVGLVWSGNPHNPKDHFRSCRLADFAPLAEVPGVTFYSLQKGPAAEQTTNPPASMKLINLHDQLTDFAETAGAIAQLDLVISVDTSVAHLAGALGKPVWTLLAYSSDFRWMVVRDDTPWYPTMRLFRQTKHGDWSDTLRGVADALRTWSIDRAPLRVLRTPLPLDQALAYAQQDRRQEAIQAFQQIIDLQPYHAEAVQLLGKLLFREGRAEEAVGVFQRAVELQPGDAVLHFNLGVVLAGTGRTEEALASYRRALAIDPPYAEVYFNLANALRDRGQVSEAIDHYQKALATKPDYIKARINLGHVLRRDGRCDEAIAQYEHALVLQPTHANALYSLALTYQQQGDRDKALSAARQAISLQPDSADIQNGLGVILQEAGQLTEALTCHDRALALRPQYPEAFAQRAAVLCRLGRAEEATQSLEKALSQRPQSPETCHKMAKIAMNYFGRLDAAEALLTRCLTHDPGWAEAHFDLGELRFFQGNLRAGFAEHAWRFKIKTFACPIPAAPTWDGSVQKDKTLLLFSEQGYGDMFQFLRYVPMACERVGRVVIGCPQSLVRLLAMLPGVAAVADRGDHLPPFDECLSILSLPHVLEATLADIPAEVPYLRPPETRQGLVPVVAGAKFKVGIVWSGNPQLKQNVFRASGIEHSRALLGVPEIAFYSFQVGPRADDLHLLGDLKHRVVDLAPQLCDWAETAAALGQMDLVITVDTGVAHLAGALGKPTWLLLAFIPDARWMLHGDSSPWYPTMRLFRQSKFGDWHDVFERVGKALMQLVASRRHWIRLLDTLEHARRGLSFLQRHKVKSPSVRLDKVFADDLIGAVIRPFHQDEGAHRLDQLPRSLFVENADVIDALQGTHDHSPFFLPVDRAAIPFGQTPYTGVRIEPDHESIAQATRLAQNMDMPRMQQIKTAVREDNRLARFLQRAKFLDEGFLRHQLVLAPRQVQHQVLDDFLARHSGYADSLHRQARCNIGEADGVREADA